MVGVGVAADVASEGAVVRVGGAVHEAVAVAGSVVVEVVAVRVGVADAGAAVVGAAGAVHEVVEDVVSVVVEDDAARVVDVVFEAAEVGEGAVAREDGEVHEAVVVAAAVGALEVSEDDAGRAVSDSAVGVAGAVVAAAEAVVAAAFRTGSVDLDSSVRPRNHACDIRYVKLRPEGWLRDDDRRPRWLLCLREQRKRT